MTEFRWTEEQAEAIVAERDLLLTANAGTGKTSTVVGKILWLLGLDVGLPPCPSPCGLDEIAAITFTEKAAHDLKRKLRERIAAAPGAQELVWQIDRATLGTIHGFCGQILREYALRLGIDPTFRVLDERASRLEQDALVRQVIMDALADGDTGAADLVEAFTVGGYSFTSGAVDYVRDVMRDIRWHGDRYARWVVDGQLDPEVLRGLWNQPWDPADDDSMGRCETLTRLANSARTRWAEYMEDENVRDYDALILDTRALLDGPHGEAARLGLQRRYRILIIDEFQDTDAAQRDIAYAIGRSAERPQLFLVGDPKQSIYGFRGADIAVWNQVARDFGPEGTLTLTQNFRSQPAIVDFVNAALSVAIDSTGAAVEQEIPGTSVAYASLVVARDDQEGAVEWLRRDDDEKRDCEWLPVAIEKLIGRERIVDPDSGQLRPCTHSDIAVLYRTRNGGAPYQAELRRRKIPFYEQGQAGLMTRQEVVDVVNALHVIQNPADDLRAFAFLRSPFVGLRDEVLARIRMDPGLRRGSLLERAAEYLAAGEWFGAPEHAGIAEVERQGLRRGLALLGSMRQLGDRLPLDELVEHLLEETGYRAHLHLLEGTREAIANLHSVIRVAEEFRDRPLGSFLDLWTRWEEGDQGLPQAPLYSREDNVVTLSTIHAAKGLEWPIVFLVNVGGAPRDSSSNSYWSDSGYGPVFCPSTADRGARSAVLLARRRLEETAEEARLLYVASTRARDRLVIIGQEKKNSFGLWLSQGRAQIGAGMITGAPPSLEAEEVPRIPLTWLDSVSDGVEIETVTPIREPRPRWITSATELMQRARDERLWTLMYRYGVQPGWMFARRPRRQGGPPVPATLHGTLVHGVLERIRDEQELAAILEETIGDLAAPELEAAAAVGTEYRAALEAEIRQVITSDEWRWYVEGEHYRELPFLHRVGPREWRTGAFDLYRPGLDVSWIIDFKTHDVPAARARHESESYHIQARVYREAAEMHGTARVRLHFTRPNVVVEMDSGGE